MAFCENVFTLCIYRHHGIWDRSSPHLCWKLRKLNVRAENALHFAWSKARPYMKCISAKPEGYTLGVKKGKSNGMH